MKKIIPLLLIIALSISCAKEEQLTTKDSSPETTYNLKCSTPPTESFWETVSPSSQQMDENIMAGLSMLIENLNHVKSFLVIRNGKIVLEKYSNGADVDSLVNICSITKRITSSLVGIAIDKRIIRDADKPIAQYFPEIWSFNADPQWKKITIAQLLNMTSGMDWIEVIDIPAFENTFYNPNPLPMTFSRNIIHEPGTIFSYNSPSVHLLSYVLERSSKKCINDFAQRNLFGPLKIKNFYWQSDGNHVNNGAANLFLAPRDLAKIGLLYLQNGMWQNRPVISKKWVDACLKNPINLDSLQGSYLATGPDMVSKPGLSIGNAWWTMNFMGETIHYGDGYGGQMLVLIPKYNVIVVMNRDENVSVADNINAFNEFFYQVLPMVMVGINK